MNTHTVQQLLPLWRLYPPSRRLVATGITLERQSLLHETPVAMQDTRETFVIDADRAASLCVALQN